MEVETYSQCYFWLENQHQATYHGTIAYLVTPEIIGIQKKIICLIKRFHALVINRSLRGFSKLKQLVKKDFVWRLCKYSYNKILLFTQNTFVRSRAYYHSKLDF